MKHRLTLFHFFALCLGLFGSPATAPDSSAPQLSTRLVHDEAMDPGQMQEQMYACGFLDRAKDLTKLAGFVDVGISISYAIVGVGGDLQYDFETGVVRPGFGMGLSFSLPASGYLLVAPMQEGSSGMGAMAVGSPGSLALGLAYSFADGSYNIMPGLSTPGASLFLTFMP